MPYKTDTDLPKNVQHVLPQHAQDIFREAYNSALETYKDPNKRQGDEDQEEAAVKVAWSAVKKSYEKGADDKWHPKS